MYTHERCFSYRYGENGRLNNPKATFCEKGVLHDSQTGEVINTPRCIDWFRSCYRLKPIKIH